MCGWDVWLRAGSSGWCGWECVVRDVWLRMGVMLLEWVWGCGLGAWLEMPMVGDRAWDGDADGDVDGNVDGDGDGDEVET
jgi:hypothetical protein